MGFLARRRERKQKQALADSRYRASLRESYAHPVYGTDPASTALLLATMSTPEPADRMVPGPDVDPDEDVSDNADDTGRDESAVDDTTTEPTYTEPDTSSLGYSDSSNYDSGSSYDSSSSYDSGSSSSYDSGSSYSSSDSGGSFDSGSY